MIAAREGERNRSERSGTPFCIAMIDLDRFKQVNDSYGHAPRRRCLRAFFGGGADTMRATDVFGRYGARSPAGLVGTTTAAALEAVELIRTRVASRDWRPIVPTR